jgi:hypothetical protein
MNKTYYITDNECAKEVTNETVTRIGNFLYHNSIRTYSKVYYLVEDSEENKEWILFKIPKGNINPKFKRTIDIDRLAAKEEAYHLHDKTYHSLIERNRSFGHE